MFDQAVVTFGMILENAAQEMVNNGTEDKPQWRHKYDLQELLMPGGTIEHEESAAGNMTTYADGVQLDLGALRGLHSGVGN